MRPEEARTRVIQEALRRIAADYANENADAASESEYADEQLALAARDLTRAMDALIPSRQPVGWAADGEAV